MDYSYNVNYTALRMPSLYKSLTANTINITKTLSGFLMTILTFILSFE